MDVKTIIKLQCLTYHINGKHIAQYNKDQRQKNVLKYDKRKMYYMIKIAFKVSG